MIEWNESLLKKLWRNWDLQAVGFLLLALVYARENPLGGVEETLPTKMPRGSRL